MNTTLIEVPNDRAELLRQIAVRQGITIDEVIDRMIKQEVRFLGIGRAMPMRVVNPKLN